MMNAKENTASVSVYNILGQEVKNISPHKLNAELDLTALPSGTYLIRAFIDEKMGSFKVIKN